MVLSPAHKKIKGFACTLYAHAPAPTQDKSAPMGTSAEKPYFPAIFRYIRDIGVFAKG
jgi:hypothetical protein